MKRSISTLVITLLFSTVATVPNAMAQMQKPGVPVDLSIGSAAIPEQSASDPTKPASTKTTVLPETATSPAPNVKTLSAEQSRSSMNDPSVDSSYPAYCLPLPAGVKPDDWEYREALEKCLYGN